MGRGAPAFPSRMGKAGDTFPGLTVMSVRQQHPTDHPKIGQGEGAQWGGLVFFWLVLNPKTCGARLSYSLRCSAKKPGDPPGWVGEIKARWVLQALQAFGATECSKSWVTAIKVRCPPSPGWWWWQAHGARSPSFGAVGKTWLADPGGAKGPLHAHEGMARCALELYAFS